MTQAMAFYVFIYEENTNEKINLSIEDKFNISLPQTHHYPSVIPDLGKL